MQEDCLSIRNGWNLNAFNSGMIESDLHGFSPVCFHFNSDCLSANPNSIPSDAPKQKSLWFCTPSLFEVNDFDEIVQNLNLDVHKQPLDSLGIFINAFSMPFTRTLLHLACFVIYCWLQSCLFSEADGIQLCGKEQHLRDAQQATPLMTCFCPMPQSQITFQQVKQ